MYNSELVCEGKVQDGRLMHEGEIRTLADNFLGSCKTAIEMYSECSDGQYPLVRVEVSDGNGRGFEESYGDKNISDDIGDRALGRIEAAAKSARRQIQAIDRGLDLDCNLI